ncbi:uncharacterized protein LOC135137422 isoform X2 [Zophobas morio]|uniref:uncharacterized protein LOC135137422 isoform X2 n=1 Tax=Zophobas morio TaxID=2755281 RepID=UPI0030831F26
MKVFILTLIAINFCGVYGNYDARPIIIPKRFPRQTETGCVLPFHPQFGNWTVYNSTSSWSPEKIVPSGTILEVSCDDNYLLDGLKFINCIGSSWRNSIGRCLKKCPPPNITEFLTVRCLDSNKNNIDCSEAVENSTAEYVCQDFYEIEHLNTINNNNITSNICVDGKWTKRTPKCVPECGKNRFGKSTSRLDTSVVRQEDYPWQVAIYNGTNRKELICGGSLLSQRVVLTAAYCISDIDGNYYSQDTYIVAVGKYYRIYDDERDFGKASFSGVYSMHYPNYYHGQSHNFYGDIAIIITKKQFVLSARVRPVCFERSETKEDYSTLLAYVTGWGFTHEDGKFSDELRALEVPLVSYQQCLEKLPTRFHRFITDDKVCAGYFKKSTSVCKGDGGGGLIFKRKNRYYVHGIVSVGPSSPRFAINRTSCNSQQYTVYTKVLYYRRFIEEKLTFAEKLSLEEVVLKDENKTKTSVQGKTAQNLKKCSVPKHPKFAHWSNEDVNNDYKSIPGQLVESGTRLRINCNTRYLLNGSSHLTCEDGSWSSTIGNCIKTCPPLYNTTILKVQCSNTGDLYNENCVSATDGTLAKFQCSDFYEDDTPNMNPINLCVNGRWNYQMPQCSPECGKLRYDNGKENYFSWQATIYTTNKDIICSGSLINEKVVLTAAHCVTDTMSKLKPKDTFLVVVGNHYRSFKYAQDYQHSQISRVEDIFLLESKNTKTYSEDVAILIVKETFKFSERVQPICLNKVLDTKETFTEKYMFMNGYGYNIDKFAYPDTLKTVRIPIDSLTNCTEKFVSNNSFLNRNKLCVEHVNNNALFRFNDLSW